MELQPVISSAATGKIAAFLLKQQRLKAEMQLFLCLTTAASGKTAAVPVKTLKR